MTGARIGVVIPVHDREALIGRAIESALSQSAPPTTVVVVDDGSTDGTWRVIESYGERVVGIRQANTGVARARYAGAAHLAAAPEPVEWLALLDSDDTWDADHLARAADAIERTEGRAGLYFADTELAPSRGGGSLWAEAGFEPELDAETRACFARDATDWVVLARQPMMLQSSIFALDAFLAASAMASDFALREDTRILFELGLGGPACAVAGVGARMSDDGGGARLTARHHADSRVYQEDTRLLYGDLLARPGTPARVRRELAPRLAAAHLRLAKLSPSLGEKAHHLAAAFRADRGRFFQAIGRRLGRG